MAAAPLLIRPAVPGDLDAVVRLMRAGAVGGPVEPPSPLPPEYAAAFAAIAARPDDELMVAEAGGRVVGTFHLSYLVYLTLPGRVAQIESVFVDPARRGQGHGAALMRWAIARAREKGCRRLQLTSHKLRPDAHRFYERLGFARSHEGLKLEL